MSQAAIADSPSMVIEIDALAETISDLMLKHPADMPLEVVEMVGRYLDSRRAGMGHCAAMCEALKVRKNAQLHAQVRSLVTKAMATTMADAKATTYPLLY